MVKIPTTLIEELIRLGLLNKKDSKSYEDLARKEDKEFGQILIEKDVISANDLLEIKSKLYGLPIVKLEEIQLNTEALKEISEAVVNFYKIAPFGKEDDVLKVGVLNPEDVDALEALKFITSDKGLRTEKYIIDYRDFESVLKNYRSLGAEVGKALESLSEEIEKETVTKKRIEEITAEGAVTRIVASIVKYAVESRASDIHLEPFEEKVNVRFRIDGVLGVSLTLPKNVQSAVITRIKVLSNLKIDETRLAQDGRFSTSLNKRRIDFRVSTFPTKNGEKVVMRILDPLTNKIDLLDLGVTGRSLEVLERAMAKPFGSILITGPTGSGKSTTLAGMLKRLNREEVNIVTLEDPIEYFVEGVNQSQTHEEIGYTFASGLRHILRQDPDIIMVGEIRDPETAALAIQAALTGHIVLSTLHTNDAMGVVPRLIDMGVEKYLIPPTLNVAVAQRLLRRLCQDCKVKAKANVAEEGIINQAITAMPTQYQKELFSKNGYEIYKPNFENPCKKCAGKAYKGRLGVFEMLEMTDEFEKIILGNLSESAMREEAKRQGMITLFQDGILKVLKGSVSLEELLEVAQAGDSA
ncbi:MAG: GspE/PulE family protein [bacterium]|nr:GspE/PulE family protein [bacterium]